MSTILYRAVIKYSTPFSERYETSALIFATTKQAEEWYTREKEARAVEEEQQKELYRVWGRVHTPWPTTDLVGFTKIEIVRE